jgi:hypothetical protein
LSAASLTAWFVSSLFIRKSSPYHAALERNPSSLQFDNHIRNPAAAAKTWACERTLYRSPCIINPFDFFYCTLYLTHKMFATCIPLDR